MYGFVIEGIGDAVRRKMGDNTWNEIRKKANIPTTTFTDKKTYSETMIPRLVKAACDITQKPPDEILEVTSQFYVVYVIVQLAPLFAHTARYTAMSTI